MSRKVVRLYRNTTDEWVKLAWTEGGKQKQLITTPGHHFLDRSGHFPRIEEMLENSRATVVLASGELTEVTAERITSSAESAHRHEQRRTQWWRRSHMIARAGMSRRIFAAARDARRCPIRFAHGAPEDDAKSRLDGRKTIDNLCSAPQKRVVNRVFRGDSAVMGWQGAQKRAVVAAAVATLLGIASLVFLFSFAISSAAADIGLTLQRKQVLRSCMQDTSDRCGYLVFFSYQARPLLSEEEFKDNLSLRTVLPPQIAYMPFRPPREGLYSICPIKRLDVFVQRILLRTREQLSKGMFLFDVPDEISYCFQTTLDSSRDIFFLIRGGAINGFVSCRPDRVGIVLCDVEFSRRIGSLDERIAISSFRREEITELFSNFPQFPEDGRSQHETNFLNALNWVHELFSNGITEVRLGE